MVKHLNVIIIICGILIVPHVIEFLNLSLPPFTALAIGFAAGYFFNFYKSAQK